MRTDINLNQVDWNIIIINILKQLVRTRTDIMFFLKDLMQAPINMYAGTNGVCMRSNKNA